MKIQVEYFFTREKVIDLIGLVDEEIFEVSNFIDDNGIIQIAGREGLIKNVNPDKYYCFDNGNIIEQKKLEKWLKR